ncbi:unnamed protein product [Moneuplotes crassus]|uniref:ATP-dependent DNA helicase n=1 Tax=Euplotes crassus TaxID=5936 RepID=A0AAD1XZ46_EUPCR|nr:unnamed protein product [Moneuplotes crassus]
METNLSEILKELGNLEEVTTADQKLFEDNPNETKEDVVKISMNSTINDNDSKEFVLDPEFLQQELDQDLSDEEGEIQLVIQKARDSISRSSQSPQKSTSVTPVKDQEEVDIISDTEDNEEYQKVSKFLKEKKQYEENIHQQYTANLEVHEDWNDETVDYHLEHSDLPDSNLEKWKRDFRWNQDIIDTNKKVFKNDSFLPCQKEIINATKARRDVIGLIPTGGGKSLTFQLPGLTEKGFTIVVMPLLSLIEDQMQAMKKIGVKCFFFSGSKGHQKFLKDLGSNNLGDQKLIYITPEKLVNCFELLDTLDHLYMQRLIQRFVIDEAHCVVQWGNDFRRDYLGLKKIRRRFEEVPILALTAVATKKVSDEIIEQLNMSANTVKIKSSSNRPNLYYEVKHVKCCKDIIKDILKLLNSKFKDQSGIIYCATRKECDELAVKLYQEHKVACAPYHSNMSEKDRKSVQSMWMEDEIKVIVATIAFGMGINKNNVRFVIHYKLPKSLENYMQECGRAGRDQKPAHCMLYYSYSDRRKQECHMAKTSNDDFRETNLKSLYSIVNYCEEPYLCRRKMQLQHLGEKFKKKDCQNTCDNCQRVSKSGGRIVEEDYTQEAKTIAYFVSRCSQNGRHCQWTVIQLAEALTGRPCKKINKFCDLKRDFYGRLKSLDQHMVRRICLRLVGLGILKEQMVKLDYSHLSSGVATYIFPNNDANFKRITNHKHKVFMTNIFIDPNNKPKPKAVIKELPKMKAKPKPAAKNKKRESQKLSKDADERRKAKFDKDISSIKKREKKDFDKNRVPSSDEQEFSEDCFEVGKVGGLKTEERRQAVNQKNSDEESKSENGKNMSSGLLNGSEVENFRQEDSDDDYCLDI